MEEASVEHAIQIRSAEPKGETLLCLHNFCYCLEKTAWRKSFFSLSHQRLLTTQSFTRAIGHSGSLASFFSQFLSHGLKINNYFMTSQCRLFAALRQNFTKKNFEPQKQSHAIISYLCVAV